MPSLIRRALAAVGAVLLLAGMLAVLPASPADAGGAAPACAVIDNGTVRLGVNPEGHLNCGDAGVEGGFVYGITYLPSGPTADGISPGCYCEGWGAGDAVSLVQGGASESNAANFAMEVESFTTDGTNATSIVNIPDATTPLLRVTHEYTPSASPALYEVNVTIENVSGATVTPRYRRAMDWDIPPTEFDEYVTIQGSEAAEDVIYSSDDGFADVNPFAGPSFINFEGDAVDNLNEVLPAGGEGDSDHGALFDFEFDDLAAGDTKEFTIFYGAAGSEDDADAALGAVGAEMYSYGQPNVEGGPDLGEPNTFIFAFEGVGGLVQFPSVQFSSPTYSVDEDAGEAVITATLSGATSNPVAVDYASAAGTATAGDDYTDVSGTLTIPAGETSATFSIPIEDDGVEEPDETVDLTLSAPTNAFLGDPSEAVLTIVDVTPPPAPPATPTPAAPTFTG